MSDAGSSVRASRPDELRFVWVGENPVANPQYQVGALPIREEPHARTLAVIFVTTFEDRILVALPHKAWDRRVAKRKLPGASFSRPVFVEVAAAVLEDREQRAPHSVKVWLGLLSRDLADLAVFEPAPDPDCDVSFLGPDGQPALPFAPALVALILSDVFRAWKVKMAV